jgi:hypothetical protein
VTYAMARQRSILDRSPEKDVPSSIDRLCLFLDVDATLLDLTARRSNVAVASPAAP